MRKPTLLVHPLLIIVTSLFLNTSFAATEKAIFAGGCFWCMEPPFDKLDGVISTTSGYTGGQQKNPTYYDVSSGRSGHVEVVEIVYDPAKVSYEKLLNVFWVNIDPLNDRGQFCDNGSQYLSAIFYPAEEYHQDYYINNSLSYKYYRYRCGRDSRLKELWPSRKES